MFILVDYFLFFFQAEDGIRYGHVTGVQTCALPICSQAVPAEERDYVQAIRAAPDAETKIVIYASAMRTIAGRLAPVLGIIQQAAPAEPELASLWREISERRAANMHRFVTDLAAVATLRVDTGAAADIVWATNAPELYQLLVCQRGWTPERYEQFLADSWQRLLLAG